MTTIMTTIAHRVAQEEKQTSTRATNEVTIMAKASPASNEGAPH